MAEERKGFLREAVELFGFRIGRPEREQPLPSFVPPSEDDGAIAINEGGAFGTTVDLDNRIKSETQLITKYREMALQPEAEKAIDDIVNEAIIIDDNKMPVEMNLDEIEELSDDIKDLMREEFEHCLKLLNLHICLISKFRLHFLGKFFYISKNFYLLKIYLKFY